MSLATITTTRAAVPALMDALADDELRVRVQVGVTLWQIDQQRQLTVPVLLEAARSPDYITRQEAMKGLIAMEGFPLIQPRVG